LVRRHLRRGKQENAQLINRLIKTHANYDKFHTLSLKFNNVHQPLNKPLDARLVTLYVGSQVFTLKSCGEGIIGGRYLGGYWGVSWQYPSYNSGNSHYWPGCLGDTIPTLERGTLQDTELVTVQLLPRCQLPHRESTPH